MIQHILTEFQKLKVFINSSESINSTDPAISVKLNYFEDYLFENLKKNELELENYKDFFENTSDYIFILSEEGKVISANKAACRKYEMLFSEFKGISIDSIDASDNRDEIRKNINELITFGKTRFETIHKSKSGKRFNVDVIAHKIYWNGKPAYINVCRNVTRQKQLQQELNESEIKFKNIIDQIKDGVIIFERNGSIIIWNSGTERITGINRDEALKKKVYDLQYKLMHETQKNKQLTKKNFDEIVSLDGSELLNNLYEYEIFVNKQGVKTIQAIAFPVDIDSSRRLYGTVIRDITEMKEIENKLRELNETKDKIFSVIAHDLRTPFNSIIGFTDLLLENFDNFNADKVKQILQYVNASAKPTLGVLSNLLEWVNVQSGRYGISIEICQLKPLVKEVIEIMTPTAHIKNIYLVDLVTDNHFVLADRRMLKSVLQNLITNAIKFSYQGGQVQVKAKRKNNYIEVEVADDGIGIDIAQKQVLFKVNKFQSVNGTKGEKGSGLGLVLCNEFITRMGGKIRVVSRKGRGSRFIFKLPSAVNNP